MKKERDEKLEELEKLNELLNPRKYIYYKKEMEQKYEYLKLIEIDDFEKEINKMLIKLQKVFLKVYQLKIQKTNEKSEIVDCIYEFRYYTVLPYNEKINIGEVKEIQKELQETRRLLLDKAQELKVIIVTSKNKEIDDEILKNIFTIRILTLEDIYIKLIKEKDKVYIQLFDDDIFEEKVELKDFGNINKKDLEVKVNKKIKVFN